MKRGFAYFLGIFLAIMLIVALLFTSVELCAFDLSFYQNEYEKLKRPQAIGISEDELMKVTEHLLGYMRGDRDDLSVKAKIMGQSVSVFAKRDREHMADVRELYLSWARLRNIALLAIAAGMLVIYLLMRRDTPVIYDRSYLVGTIFTLALLALLGGWIAMDFTGFWTTFHLIFFTNDLWMLSPETSVLIQMVPEQFFLDIVIRIITLFAVAVGALAILSAGVIWWRARKRKTMMSTREMRTEDGE